MCKVIIVYIAIGISGEIIVALWGPFPQWFCHFQLIFKLFTVTVLFLLVDCILIVRYVLIFWMKNACIAHDDFWNTFLLIWVLCFGGILQQIYAFMPGKLPLDVYICIGALPMDYQQLPAKSRLMFIVIIATSLLLGLLSTARVKILKRRIVAIENGLSMNITKLAKHDKNLLIRKAWYLAAVGLLMICVLVLGSLYRPSTSDVADYLFLNLYWVLHLILPFSICSMWCTLFASRGLMRKELVKETKNLFSSFAPNQNWVDWMDSNF